MILYFGIGGEREREGGKKGEMEGSREGWRKGRRDGEKKEGRKKMEEGEINTKRVDGKSQGGK